MGVWLSGQWFGPDVIREIEMLIDADRSITRSGLSRRVCERLDWRGANGRLCEVGCRKALVELERRGHVVLPEVQNPFLPRRPRVAGDVVGPPVSLDCDLGELGEIEIVVVGSRYQKVSEVWNALFDSYHYLGSGPLCGAQIRYLIHSSSSGWLGGLSFSGATWHLGPRDRWIGWSDRARRANLQRLVCNSRFLILPTVHVPHLASHVLGAVLRRLCTDWLDRYGVEPVLVETFVDPQRFDGTCYKAANWVHVGVSAGEKNRFANGKQPSCAKDIYVYPLAGDCQAVLCAEPVDPLECHGVSDDADWIETEFGRARIGDPRLRRRLHTIVGDFFVHPTQLIPEACDGNTARAKATYRFLSNPNVDKESLLKGHIEATAGRIREHDVVLVPQDTTTLNYTSHPDTEGLGPIHGKCQGVIVHDAVAFTTSGTPLGVIDAQCWARDPEELGKAKQREHHPVETKESMKWLRTYRATAAVGRLCPDTTLVSVADREGDIHEVFAEAAATEGGPKLLIRAERTRLRKVGAQADTDGDEYLWEYVTTRPVAGQLTVEVPRSGSRRARTATLEVRHCSVTLRPPTHKKHAPAVPVWAVHVRETDTADDVTPLEWMLLTTADVADLDDAIERVRWYTLRWGIEVFHRVLKSGCRVEDRQLNTVERIETCLALDMVIGWRVFWLAKQGRETPDIPCDVFLDEHEWKVLYAAVHKAPPPQEPPTLREAVRMIAKFGGFLGRKNDGEPGTTTIWRGLQHLNDMMVGYKTAQYCTPGPSP